MSGPARRKRWGWAAAVLAGGLLLGLAGCRNDNGQLPKASGEAIATKAEQVKDFTLLRAYPDQKSEGLSLALEFSRPLVGTQDFDKLVRFEEKVGNDDSSWTLSDDGLTLRYPFVEAGKEISPLVSEDLLSAAGRPLAQEMHAEVVRRERTRVGGGVACSQRSAGSSRRYRPHPGGSPAAGRSQGGKHAQGVGRCRRGGCPCHRRHDGRRRAPLA